MVTCTKCGSVDDFNTQRKANNNCAYCNTCGAFIKNIPSEEKPKFHFGKFKGHNIEDVSDLHYLEWVRDNIQNFKGRYRTALLDRINSLTTMLR